MFPLLHHSLSVPCLGLLAISGVLPTQADESLRAPIWELSDDDSTVYLAGSVHLLREEDMPIPPAFFAVYEEAEELVFEIDMVDMTSPVSANKMREQGTLPRGETLADYLSPETMKALRDYLDKRGMRANLFDRLTPGMVYITLGSLEAVRNGAKPELGLESKLYEKSVQDKKPSRGLETTEYQMSRFNEFDRETIDSLIRETLEEEGEADEVLDEIISAWRSGDSEQIEELIVDRMSEKPEVKRILLSERNRNWIPQIEKALAGETDVMFLVGAAHLAGEDSVIDLLEKRGHTISQWSSKK